MPNNERNEILSPDMILVIEEYLKSLNKQLWYNYKKRFLWKRKKNINMMLL
jgi:hypothetical protein